MSEPRTAATTTAMMLAHFARELAAYKEIEPITRHELVLEAGRRLLDGSADITVASNV